ncbi:MAG: gamma-glutamyltransferase [Desulfobacterales bacterium]
MVNGKYRPIVAVLCVVALVCLLFGSLSAVSARPPETPGVPPGKVLPDRAKAPPTAGPPTWAGKAYRQGVVSVSHPLAAEAGARALEKGGNAVDAAAAIQFALNVVEPQFSGIGGGGFMMIHWAETGETFVIESREKAPAAATPDMFDGLPFAQASSSGLAVGVPGTLLGVETALREYGTISLAEAIAPAYRLAKDGFAINRFLAADTASARTTYQPETAAVFRLPSGAPLPEGYWLRQPDLARTLRLIAREGSDVFYRGDISEAIVEAQQRSRTSDPARGIGRMSLEDLDAYDVRIRQPVVGDYRGYTLKSMSPPSSGGLTVIQMLKMLERFPMGDAGQGFGFGETRTLHVMIEAMRLAFADRAVWMGDEDFVDVPKVGLIDDDYLAMRSALIDPDTRLSQALPDDPRPYDLAFQGDPMTLAALASEPEHGHTTHFSVVDKWGNVVSYTTTIEAGWGTGIMVPGYGFLLNNELTDFNFTPTYNPDPANFNPGANDVAPFKRPRSSMAPSILFKGDQPIAAYGSPGGATIINSVFQITLNLIDHGMTIQEAIDAPRISSTTSNPAGATVSREAGFSDEVIDALESLGHSISNSTSTIGSVQGVVIDLQTGKLYGGADQRREGTVIGLPRPRSGRP